MHVVEAKHLMKKDIGMLGKGKSDPYAVVTVGAQEFKTKTINNSVDPKWDFWCEVRCHQPLELNTVFVFCSQCYFGFCMFFHQFLYRLLQKVLKACQRL